jgi:hypothetical protein
MRAYLPRRNMYLQRILAGEGISSSACESCQLPGRWRCLCCLGRPLFCRRCCRSQHQRLIFHRVQKWTGKFFQDASLWEVGVRLSIGHGGDNCPSQETLIECCATLEERKDELDRLSILHQSQNFHSNSTPAADERMGSPTPEADERMGSPEPQRDDDDDPEDPTWEDVPPDQEYAPLRTPMPAKDDLDIEHLLIFDSSGLISLPVIWCRCAASDQTQDEMLIDLQLLPASYEKIRTVFTFRCLDDYRLSNLECKTTAYQYFQRLKRLTNPAFPNSVPNRYHEFRRCSRQWRDLKLRKWFGFGHRILAPSRGDLALFCAACPQPGVNLPANYASRFTE